MNSNVLTPAKPIILLTALILSIPLIAMQFTDEVNWGIEDFVAMGILLMGTGIIFEFSISKLETTRQKVVVGLGILLIFLFIWAELAVGVIS